MSLETNIDKALERVAKKMQRRIELQVPVKSGALKRSVDVYVKDGAIIVSYDEYGRFTNYGTERYEISEIDDFQGYQKGTDGIRPQEWTAIPETTYDEVNQNVVKEIDKEITKIFQEQEIEIIEITL